MNISSNHQRPITSVFSKKAEMIHQRMEQVSNNRKEAIKASRLETQIQDSISADEDGGLNFAVTKAIVSGEVAIKRVEDAYRTKVDITGKMMIEGETEKLQEALARASEFLAARIGETLANVEKHNAEITNAKEYKNDQKSDEFINIAKFTENIENKGSIDTTSLPDSSQQQKTSAKKTKERLVRAYISTVPSSSSVINTTV